MEIKATKYLDKQAFDLFFDQNRLVEDYNEQKDVGYFLYQGDQAIAFFSLIAVDDQKYWLRSLLMKRYAPLLLPVSIIQSAEQIATDQQASYLVTHSTNTMLDDLFTQLGYKRTNQALDHSIEASWWITNLANVDKNSSYTQV